MINIAIQTEDFDVAQVQRQVYQLGLNIGAVVSFVGLVRAHNGQPSSQTDVAPISKIHLEHYPMMAEKCIYEIAELASQRYQLQAVSVIHRVGELAAGEQIVLVLSAAAHRQAAFDGCQMVMDYLKSDAPFWKKEYTAVGEHWVEAKSSDMQAKQYWEQSQ
jgi:molybdopterin synthase catalytic subunit